MNRTGSAATSKTWPATTTGSTTPAGCCRRATRSPATCTPRAWRCARPPARSSPTGWASSASPLRSGCERASRRSPARRGDPPRRRPAAPAVARPSCCMLAPNVWPRNTVRGDDGVVSHRRGAGDRHRRTSTAPRCSSSTRTTSGRAAARSPRRSAAASNVRYAAKAFLCTEVARWIDEEGLSLDVCSGGELAVALHADFPPERIALHGNNKSVAELTAAVKAGVGHVVLDSMTEIERLDAIAGEAGVVQDVLVRVTVGVEAHTHEFISTAHEDQKFGLSLASGAAMAAVRRVFADRPPAAGRTAQPHRLADLRRRRLRDRRAPGDRPAARRRRRIRCRQDRADLDRRPRWRPGHLVSAAGRSAAGGRPGRQARAPSCATSRRRSACPRRRWWSSPAGPSPGPGTITLYEVGTVKDVAVSADRAPPLRQRRRRHERQHPDLAVRRRVRRAAGLPSQRRGARRWPVSSESTARAAISSSATRGCPTTSRPATCSASPPPARTAIRCRAVTT